jgi:hypothetical protein
MPTDQRQPSIVSDQKHLLPDSPDDKARQHGVI